MKYSVYTLARQLASVRRYSRDYSVCEESVLEHMGFCALFCLATAHRLMRTGQKIDIAGLMQKALLHDIEEAETGDINRAAKYATDDIRNAFEEYENNAASKICYDVFTRDAFNYWSNAKDGTIEGKIVQLADFAAVAYHVHNELFVLNNKSFLRVQKEAIAYVEQKKKEQTDPRFVQEYGKVLHMLTNGAMP